MNLSPSIQYGLIVLVIVLISGVLAYLKVVPNTMFLILFSAAVGHIAGVNLTLPAPNTDDTQPTTKP